MLDDFKINISGNLDFSLPEMVKVKQKFESRGLPSISEAVYNQMDRKEIKDLVKPGSKIAVGVGSRGVANISKVVGSLVDSLKNLGAKPFIFPAMGSHGGGTAEAQKGLLAGYGVTEEKVGAPIISSMETIVVSEMDDGTLVHMDRNAYEADGDILVNRVKPHTSFRGDIESGIVKMMTIGMGKINGASMLHGSYPMAEFGKYLPRVAKKLLPNINFLFGVGLVEDAYDDTAIIECIPSDILFDREKDLQKKAKLFMGKLYIDNIDVLVIDEIGKEISGAGCDPNVTGRNMRGVSGFDKPLVNKIVLLDLTDATHGNATGFSSADVITQKLLNKVDFSVTYANVIASTYLEGGKIPIPMKTSEDALRLAIKTLNGIDPMDARIVRIKNTLELSEISISNSLLSEARDNDLIEVIGEPKKIEFNDAA